jgi:regulator of sigma E protease
MPDIVIAILAVIFVLGVAINIHEFGHFIVAKMLGMRVEAYSFFGLGPRIWGFRWGHTDYRISAIPLGAYVKLYGDEATSSLEGGSSAGDAVPQSELYELRPRWQKFLVMIGGPFMNIVLALAIPFIGAMMYGVPVMPAPIVGIVVPGGAGDQAGIKTGDRIVKFDGVENPTWQRIENDAILVPEKPLPVVVERNGERVNLTVTPRKIEANGQPAGMLDFEPDGGEEPVIVNSTQAGMPAAEAGLKSGDRILSINGRTIRNREELMVMIREGKDAPIKLSIDRAGERLEIETRAKVSEDGVPRIGIGFGSTPATREPATLATAAAFAYNANMEILRMTGKAFGQVGTGERKASDTISGPIGIVQIISQVVLQAGWAGLFSILMVISLNLGIFNLLPIPMLDGGQIMVLGIEGFLALFGLQLSMLVKERIQLAGLGIILLLMVFVMFNDISRLLR